MAELTLLAFTIATLLAFTSAHKTIITTTIEDDINPSSQSQQCSQHLQGQKLWQCESYLQGPGLPQKLQQCCQELRNVNEPCVCKAVKKIYGIIQEQEEQETRLAGSQPIQQVKRKAQNLPQMCNIQTREQQQCNLKTAEQCRQAVQGRQFKQCRNYLEQQIGSRSVRPVGVEQCCEELRSVDVECECEAEKELHSQIAQAERSRPQQRVEMWDLGRLVEDLKEPCNLAVEICQMPFIYNAMKE